MFFSLLIIGIVFIFIIMGYVKKTKTVNKQKKRMKITKKNKKVKETMKNKETALTDEKCNEILTRKNKKCNCFDSKGHPSNNQRTCMKINHNSYCNDYNKCKDRFLSYMSGSEPEYNPSNWKNPIIEGSHNCYAYFLDDHIPELIDKCNSFCKKFIIKDGKKVCDKKPEKCNDLKPQPGDMAERNGKITTNKPVYNCPTMIKKVLLDNIDEITQKENITTVKFNEKCPVKYYKGAIVVHPNKTYHFYRQDNNGQFSHKQGVLEVENIDASNNPIWSPHLADRDYQKDKNDGINYTDFCTYFCIPKNYFKKTNAI